MLQSRGPSCNPFSCEYQRVRLRCAVATRRSQGTPSAPNRPRRKGLFITFEGIEGSGKSTQAQALAQYLRDQGFEVVETREPGGTPMAEHIREVFLRPARKQRSGDPLVPECEVALILAARSQHVANRLLPALEHGAVVICDRFSDSTLAYQGYGRGLPLAELRSLTRWAAKGLTPDATFLFDLPVSQGLRRRLNSTDVNRLDHETAAFHQRVRNGFLSLAQQAPRRIHTINARRSTQAIARHLIRLIAPLLEQGLKKQRLTVTRL
ncbi:MAG: dTMP kinase [Nitrospira sp. SB0666_bin_27]|nr:dTMP kinase [Nitrospira sp. SB0666_bin_27]MYF25142.1 dTMP kinase [Nitrospira sp. SB0678_bin_10]